MSPSLCLLSLSESKILKTQMKKNMEWSFAHMNLMILKMNNFPGTHLNRIPARLNISSNKKKELPSAPFVI